VPTDLPTDARSREERESAFRAYVQPELELLLRVAIRLTRDPVEAEDLVQDTLLRAYRAIDRFDGRHPRAWLLTILRNTNINRVRKRRPDLLDADDRRLTELRGRGADAREGPAEVVVERIPDEAVVAALAALSDDHRDVIHAVDVDGLSYREAADLLGVPIGTVMSRLHRARHRVRDELAAAGFVPGGRP
jgi:RNA polymerase sigma-70 factor, ECF subfamily